MVDHIANELLDDILLRLPVASLLRFTSVCKSWYSLITSPNFITKHLNQTVTSSRRNDSKLFVRTRKNDGMEVRYLLLRDAEKFGYKHTELEFPFKHLVGYFRIVGCCNGLVCLSNSYFSVNAQVILWNPSIRKSVTLPTPRDPERQRMIFYGFGVHPTTREYKVVRFDYQGEVTELYYKIPPKAEIYEQGTSSWRAVSSAAPPYRVVIDVNSISRPFFNGAVHWVAYYRHEGVGLRNSIISFNMEFESFSEIMLPPTLADQHPGSLSIKSFRESLVVVCSGERDGGAGCIWMMKEYGVAETWIKIFSPNPLGKPNKIMGIWKNGEVLLASANSLASYAPGTKTSRDAGIRGISSASYVDPFIETLVLLEERNDVSQGRLTFRVPTSKGRRG